MASSVRERDNGYAALRDRLKQAKGTVTVGIHEAEGSEAAGEGDLTVLDVANIHEFGAPEAGIPRRSMIADWSDETEDANREAMKRGAEAVIKGDLPSVHNALERAGLKFVGDVQTRMVGGIDPPLAESTIEKKGSSTPLIDTGQLRSSIRHEVKDE